jgi:hypothetical protein
MESMRWYGSAPEVAVLGTAADLHVRIAAEFREMPGLVLTLAQAARLFSVDLAQCERVMLTLVRDGVLTFRDRSFMRAGTDCRWR